MTRGRSISVIQSASLLSCHLLPTFLLRLWAVPILTRLMSLINRAEVPESWQWYVHPNRDVYYYNLGMRLLSTDDIRNPDIRATIVGIRNECYEELAQDWDFQHLPIDWVMTITDCNIKEKCAVVGIHSRTAGKSYGWKDGGMSRAVFFLLLDSRN